MTKSNKSCTVRQLTAALEVIAKFFHESSINPQTGEETNALAYVQKQMLNSLCWKAQTELERAKNVTKPKAVDDLKRAQRFYRGDEISSNQLRQRVEWHDKIVEQISLLEMFYAHACAVYEKHTGQSFERGQLEAKTAKTRREEDPWLARAAKITGGRAYVDATVPEQADV